MWLQPQLHTPLKLVPALSGMRVLLPWLFSGQATERHFELWQLNASKCSGALYTFDGMQVLPASLASPSPGAAIKKPVEMFVRMYHM